MGEEPTEMEAWLKRFASVREDARLNPAILRPSIPGFQPAPASQLGGGVASQVEAEGSFANAGDCLQGSDRTLESWVPQWLSLEFGEPSVVLTADEQSHSVTMADEMQVFRKKVRQLCLREAVCPRRCQAHGKAWPGTTACTVG